MRNNKSLFWNVDTQFDFMFPEGKLYVNNAEEIIPVLSKITELAFKKKIQVINTIDYHLNKSKELSDKPDFINTFPPHCMANTQGAEHIQETKCRTEAYILNWDNEFSISELKTASEYQNIIIRKDAFDVFEGNKHTEKLIELINPKTIFVYGVTTNVCVDKAVIGLAKRGYKIYVIADAIKELTTIPLPFGKWKTLNIKFIEFDKLESLL